MTKVGIEPTNDITRLSTWPLYLFAYLADQEPVPKRGQTPKGKGIRPLFETGSKSRVQESHLTWRGYEPLLSTGPPAKQLQVPVTIRATGLMRAD